MSSSSTRILAAATALTLAATAAPLAAAAGYDTPQLSKKSPILFVDNEIGKGTIAVAFRTDQPLDRKSNGKSIDGNAGVKGHRNSLSSFVKDKAYIAYIAGVSAGIAEALVETALGLFVAIPAVWFYNYLTSRLE
mgnify:CR=1 FL=1